MKYKAVIFDLDGTILSTLDDLSDSLNYALKENGRPERTTDQVRSFIGNGMRKLIERGVPDNTTAEITDSVHKTFTTYYKTHCSVKTRPYDQIIEMLKSLKSFPAQ